MDDYLCLGIEFGNTVGPASLFVTTGRENVERGIEVSSLNEIYGWNELFSLGICNAVIFDLKGYLVEFLVIIVYPDGVEGYFLLVRLKDITRTIAEYIVICPAAEEVSLFFGGNGRYPFR